MKVLAIWLTSIKYIKQFRKWLEARSDQQTAEKAWSDYIVNWLLKQIELNLWQEAASIYRY